jgi:hypothetical protein
MDPTDPDPDPDPDPQHRVEVRPCRSVSAWYLAYLKQLIMQTVHKLQLDSADTDSLPKGSFLQGNPNILSIN